MGIFAINKKDFYESIVEPTVTNELTAEEASILMMHKGYKEYTTEDILSIKAGGLEKLQKKLKPEVPVEGTPKIINDIKYTTFTLPEGKVVIGEFKGTGAKGDSFIDEIKVDDLQRRKGVGSALLKAALE